MIKSYVKTDESGTVFSGPEAVHLFRAISTRSGLRLYAKTGILPATRWTPSTMLRMASEYTGRKYKRGQYLPAIDDLTAWISKASKKLGLPSSCE